MQLKNRKPYHHIKNLWQSDYLGQIISLFGQYALNLASVPLQLSYLGIDPRGYYHFCHPNYQCLHEYFLLSFACKVKIKAVGLLICLKSTTLCI